jgi:hypothetical protein
MSKRYFHATRIMQKAPTKIVKGHTRYCVMSLLLTVILLANASGCSYEQQGTVPAPPNGKISVQAVSSELAKKLAEPNAGLSGHKVTVLNPGDRSVVASGTTNGSGFVDFDEPAGTYSLVGASNEPQSVQVQAGKTTNYKLVLH